MWSLLGKKSQVTIILVTGLLAAWTIDAGYALALQRDPGVIKLLSLVATAVGTVLVVIAESCWRWVWRRAPILGPIDIQDSQKG